MRTDFTPDVTPIEEYGGVLIKRDDAWSRGGASGAKARAMFAIAEDATGIVSVGARISPQLERAALVARALGVPCELHTGWAKHETPELACAIAAGATVFEHAPGRLSVIRARYRDHAATRVRDGWAAVPYGMEHPEYLCQVAHQAATLPYGTFARVVVPVGSGMTLAGICTGLADAGIPVPVLGVRVGGDPTAILDRHAPAWQRYARLMDANVPYATAVAASLDKVILDPHYEAKCFPHLRDGDLLWTVGVRTSAETAT